MSSTTTKTSITNLGLYWLGQQHISSITDTGDVNAVRANSIIDQVIDEALTSGPEKGWKFARQRKTVSIDEHAITAFSDYSGTVSGTVRVTCASHGLSTGEKVNITDTSNYNNTYVVTSIDSNSYYIEETYAGTETGTSAWTSEEYFYRFAIPTTPVCLRMVDVQVGGESLTDWIREGSYILTSLEDDEVDMFFVKQITDVTVFPPHFIKVAGLMMGVQLAFVISANETVRNNLQIILKSEILPEAVAMDEQEKYVSEENSSWTDIGRTVTEIK